MCRVGGGRMCRVGGGRMCRVGGGVSIQVEGGRRESMKETAPLLLSNLQ